MEVKKIERSNSPDLDEPVEINEAKIDRLLSLLHEANPEDSSTDTDEMLQFEGMFGFMISLFLLFFVLTLYKSYDILPSHL